MQGLNEGATLSIHRIGQHQVNGTSLLHETADEVTGDGRFRLVHIGRREPTLRLEHLEQQRERDRIEDTIGIGQNQSRLNRVQVPDVLAGNIISGRAVLLVTRFVNTERKRSDAQRVPRELEPTLPKLRHVPVGVRDEMMERLRIGPNNTTDRGQRFARNVADKTEMEAREVIKALSGHHRRGRGRQQRRRRQRPSSRSQAEQLSLLSPPRQIRRVGRSILHPQ